MHEKRIAIRWRDMDAYGHVNNAVFLTYLEEVRDDWLHHVLGRPDGDPWDYLLARVEIDFRRELRDREGEVIAKCGLLEIGRASVRTREELWTRAGELAAEATAVVVALDPEAGVSRPLSPAEREAFEREALTGGGGA
ncbi:MAG: acyl-CoA thioesterase [Actinomycetota bacterium]|jgi:acyl-CoA thioester hydrolase|nr:acyl-CoA thioesterase [Actinomycetota bacterium]